MLVRRLMLVHECIPPLLQWRHVIPGQGVTSRSISIAYACMRICDDDRNADAHAASGSPVTIVVTTPGYPKAPLVRDN